MRKFKLTSTALQIVAFLFLSADLAGAVQRPEIVIQRDSRLPITVIDVTFRVGSANDPQGQGGIAFLLGRLLREGGVNAYHGMPARSREQIEEYLYPLAADIDVTVGREQTSLRVLTSASQSLHLFALIEQMILAPEFQDVELSRLKSETLDEVSQRAPREDEEELGKHALEWRMFGANHPYGHLVVGSVNGIKSLSKEKLIDFYSKNFTRDRVVVGVAGVVSPELEKRARTAFENLPLSSGEIKKVPTVAPQKKLRMMIVKGPFQAVGVHLGQPIAVTKKDPQFSAMYLASQGFGKHRTFVGRLMNVVRELRGLNYGTYSYIEEFPHGGHFLMEQNHVARTQQAFSVWARPTTLANSCFLLRQVLRESQNFAKDGLTRVEFEATQKHLVGAIPLLATSLERRLGYAIDASFYGLKTSDPVSLLQSQVRKLTRASVNNVIHSVISPNSFDIVVVTPDTDRMRKEIFESECSVHYPEGIVKPETIQAEDRVISRYPLQIDDANIKVVDSQDLVQ